MKNANYVEAFASVGIEIGSWPSPQDGWGWRFIHTAWNGPFDTEAQAIQDILQRLVRHTTHHLSWERREFRTDETSPEEQADDDAAWARLFPARPHEGWYWHVQDRYPVWIFRQHGRWYAHQVLPENIGTGPQEHLAPGLYEQLVRIDKQLPDTAVNTE